MEEQNPQVAALLNGLIHVKNERIEQLESELCTVFKAHHGEKKARAVKVAAWLDDVRLATDLAKTHKENRDELLAQNTRLQQELQKFCGIIKSRITVKDGEDGLMARYT